MDFAEQAEPQSPLSAGQRRASGDIPAQPHALGSGRWPEEPLLLDAVSAAVVATDLDGRIFFWNAAAEDLYGYPAAEMAGGNVLQLLVEPADEQLGQQILATVAAGRRWSGEFRVRCAGGRWCTVRLTDSPIWRDGRVVGIVGVAEDLSDREAACGDADRLSARLAELAQVTAELAGASHVASLTEVVVSRVAPVVGAPVASLSLLVDEHTLAMVGVRGAEEDVQRRWATFPVTAQDPLSDAVRTGRRILLVGRAAIEQRYPAIAHDLPGERSIVCLPLSVGERRLGVIGLSFTGWRTLTGQELDFLTMLADTCALTLDRLEAQAAVRDSAAKLRFLADVSAELASSLDYAVTLRNVARLAVPMLADWCAVELVEDGELRTLAVAHVDPAKADLAAELQRRYPNDPEAPTGAANVVRTGASELYPEITDGMLAAGTRDEEHLRLARELGLRSALVVPLTAHGRVLGAITLMSAESGRRYTEADVVFAEEVARRAALAIDNAQLHSETREAAVLLQRAVLPAALPQVAGWELAAHYGSAGRTEVGGDFYDVLPLDDGRLAVLIGDVMGRGVTAAAAMAQMRSAIRAYVALDPDPVAVLANVERMFAAFDVAQFVTLVYLVADPSRDQITLVNAGHLPPVVIPPAGLVGLVDLPPGLPLGVAPDVRAARVLPFPAGTGLVLFTDGLIERRHEDIDAGLARLVQHVAALPDAPLAQQVALLVEAQHDEDRQDDVTVLAIRRQAAPSVPTS